MNPKCRYPGSEATSLQTMPQPLNLGRGGALVVTVLALYYDDSS